MSPPEPRAERLKRETRATFLLALPLVLGQASSVAMNVIDTWLAGRHGAETLAAVAVGSQLWSVVILLLIGVLMAVPPFVSQLNGANRRREVGAVFRQALWLALAMGLGLMLLVRQAHWLLAAFGTAPEVVPGAMAFLHGVSWGAPALALFFCSRYLSEGVALTLPTMVFGIGGLLLLAPLGWLLMNGGLGLAPRGAGGLGLATALVLWTQALGFLAWLALSKRYADLGLFARFDPPRPRRIGELLAVGVPMGVSVFMEGSLFIATGLLISSMGQVAMAAHQIALVMASFFFMIPLGVAMATTVRVGHAVGAGDPSAVRWAGAAGYAIVLGTQTASAAVMVLGGGLLAAVFTDDPAVIALATTLLLFGAAFQYVDGIQALSAGALRGLKDTTVPMAITLAAYWGLGMPLGYVLGKALGYGPQGMWAGLILGLSAAAVMLTWRFRRQAYASFT